MLQQLQMVWEARSLMKKNEAFLPTWHAYVGYKLNLFQQLALGATISSIMKRNNYDPQLIQSWVDVGLAVGHIKRKGNTLIPSKKMLKYFSYDSAQCIGELAREILEMHMPTLISYPDLLQGQEKKSYYGDVYGQTVAETSALIEKRAFSVASKLLKKHEANVVLDIGCGTGGYLLNLALRNPKGKYTGIDLNEAVIENATNHAKKLGLSNVQFIHTSLEHWDLPTKHFDAIMLNNLLHYYSPEARLELLQQAKKMLKPGGIISIVTPLYFEKGGERFSSFFNAFMVAHSNLYPLPRKQELVDDAKRLGLTLHEQKTIIREGSWYLISFKTK